MTRAALLIALCASLTGCSVGLFPTYGFDVHIGDISARCVPAAQGPGDQLVFSAETAGQERWVWVTVMRGETEVVDLDLDERDDGEWKGRLPTDEFDSDCHEFDALTFRFSVEGENGTSEHKIL